MDSNYASSILNQHNLVRHGKMIGKPNSADLTHAIKLASEMFARNIFEKINERVSILEDVLQTTSPAKEFKQQVEDEIQFLKHLIY